MNDKLKDKNIRAPFGSLVYVVYVVEVLTSIGCSSNLSVVRKFYWVRITKRHGRRWLEGGWICTRWLVCLGSERICNSMTRKLIL